MISHKFAKLLSGYYGGFLLPPDIVFVTSGKLSGELTALTYTPTPVILYL
jgi:hypothetical protein